MITLDPLLSTPPSMPEEVRYSAIVHTLDYTLETPLTITFTSYNPPSNNPRLSALNPALHARRGKILILIHTLDYNLDYNLLLLPSLLVSGINVAIVRHTLENTLTNSIILTLHPSLHARRGKMFQLSHIPYKIRVLSEIPPNSPSYTLLKHFLMYPLMHPRPPLSHPFPLHSPPFSPRYHKDLSCPKIASPLPLTPHIPPPSPTPLTHSLTPPLTQPLHRSLAHPNNTPSLTSPPRSLPQVSQGSLMPEDRFLAPYARVWLKTVANYSSHTKQRRFKLFGMNSSGYNSFIPRLVYRHPCQYTPLLIYPPVNIQ